MTTEIGRLKPAAILTRLTQHISSSCSNKSMEKSQEKELVESLNKALSGYPGVQISFKPIQNMFDELLSGVKTQLAVKLYGDDIDVLKSKAEEIKEVIEPCRDWLIFP